MGLGFQVLTFLDVSLWNRGALLDTHGQNGEEAPRRASRQHRQVPLPGHGEPDADHAVAEKREGVQAGASHWRLQGKVAILSFLFLTKAVKKPKN